MPYYALHGESRVIKASEPVLRDHQDRQLHRNSQIAGEIVGMNRHDPAAYSFHDDVFNSVLQSVKTNEDMLDIDVHVLHQAAHDRGGGCF